LRRVAIQIASITFSILALELTLIRWMSQQVRVFAYFSNLLLIGAFLGIGLGIGLSRRAPRLVDVAMPLLMVLAAVVAFATPLGLTYLAFPDTAIAMWGAAGLRVDETYAENLLAIMAVFALEASVFACLGSALGALFDRALPLRAYAWDLAGSLLGVIAASALAAIRTSPPLWLFVASVPIVIWHSRRWWSIASLAAIVLFAALSIDGALFSPYNRIDLRRGPSATTPWNLYANRDNHQRITDMSPHGVAIAAESERVNIKGSAALYELPFRLPERRRNALISGAGTGNDVAAALRSGFAHVVAVEIDPVIRDAGIRLHPERPYSDPRVTSVITDARTYLESGGDGATFDTVCFGLLDSHAMFSSMSTLRLDNYVYTVQAMHRAWTRVAPGGVLTVSFAIWKQQFISDRIVQNLHAATGRWPRIVGYPTQEQTFIIDKDIAPARMNAVLAAFTPIPLSSGHAAPSTDDWPYLYLRPGVFPAGYVLTLAAVLLLAFAGARFVFGRGFYSVRRFDLPLFFMGAAFLLIETRSVTDLSLLFGSTWMVNAAVFAGVLIVAFCANFHVQKAGAPRLTIAAAVLFATLVLSWIVTPGTLTALPPLVARIVGVLVNTLPVGIAGVIFSTLLARSPDPAASLGSNLVGAIIGGVTEYASLWIGLHALTAIAAVFYAAAFLILFRADLRTGPALAPAS